MNKTFQKITSGVLMGATIFSLSPTPFAYADNVPQTPPQVSQTEGTETTYPTTLDNISIKVKDNINISSDTFTDYIESLVKSTYKQHYNITKVEYLAPTATVTFDNEQEATCEIDIDTVSPTGYEFSKTLSAISASDKENKDATELLKYVNSNLTLVAFGGNDYETAYGTAPTKEAAKFTWDNCNKEYDSMGGRIYTFTQELNGQQLTRTVEVKEETNSIGKITIDYDDNTVSTSSNMKWSLDRKAASSKWSNCTKDMEIKNTWIGNTVYFKIPATNYSSASETVSLKIPRQLDKPTETLKLTSTTHSITIENCWDFDNVEFCINDGRWRTTRGESYTFDGLDSNKSYTIKVRTCAEEGEYLASQAVSKNFKTKETTTNSVDVDAEVKDKIGYINAVATIAPELDSTTLVGSLSKQQLNKFNNILNTYLDDYKETYASLIVNHYMEKDENKDIETTDFSIYTDSIRKGIEKADLDLEYRTDFGRIYFDNETLKNMLPKSRNEKINIELREVDSISKSSNWRWLWEAHDGGAPVYKVSIKQDNSQIKNSVEYFFPYKLSSYETVDSLKVYYVDSSGNKNEIKSTYDAKTQGIRFTTNKQGYFTIVYTGKTTQFPFVDVPKSHWARETINFCYGKGLFVGETATTFAPKLEMNKAMIITLLARLDNYTPNGISDYSFTDISSKDWFADYAQWAYDKKIVTGKIFDGNSKVTREEIAKLAYTYLQKAGYNISVGKVEDFSDVKTISSNCKTAVKFMKDNGIMSGVGNNTFQPQTNVSRAEMATIMYRLYDYTENHETK